VVIRAGTPADFPALLALFDEAVAWMVARGQPGQWGEEPWSQVPRATERVREMAAHPGLWIAQDAGEVVGAVIIGSAPAHVEAVAEPEAYLELLISSRRHAGRGIGSRLVEHARQVARERGVALLRVDCWAGAPDLVGYYERQGFRRSGTFDVGGWRGQVFEQRLEG
jgi:GNAT superfamily N-acetyltransferase